MLCISLGIIKRIKNEQGPFKPRPPKEGSYQEFLMVFKGRGVGMGMNKGADSNLPASKRVRHDMPPMHEPPPTQMMHGPPGHGPPGLSGIPRPPRPLAPYMPPGQGRSGPGPMPPPPGGYRGGHGPPPGGTSIPIIYNTFCMIYHY